MTIGLREASAKRHCTVGEAVEVGRDMKAYRLILTHFSQRYPSVPILPKIAEDYALLAFDYMRVSFQDLLWAPSVMPMLIEAFPPGKNENDDNNDDNDGNDNGNNNGNRDGDGNKINHKNKKKGNDKTDDNKSIDDNNNEKNKNKNKNKSNDNNDNNDNKDENSSVAFSDRKRKRNCLCTFWSLDESENEKNCLLDDQSIDVSTKFDDELNYQRLVNGNNNFKECIQCAPNNLNNKSSDKRNNKNIYKNENKNDN